jgi:hypothetical protein
MYKLLLMVATLPPQNSAPVKLLLHVRSTA